jgi:serine/threonine protein kinase
VEVFGPYLVYEQLGIGGMARVDRAELTGSDGFQRQVALKRMLPHVAASEDMVDAFLREARLVSYLHHANVAQAYEFGEVDGVHFIAMELVTGPTLREVLQRSAQITGPMPIPVALNIINQLCHALDYAHNLCDEEGQPLGIIHRDVSPSNIIINEAGVAKLIDFGVAKGSAAGMETRSGMIKGKFGYMAPEYLSGELDARADLFAVGVIAHELLTNRPLFSVADDMETLRRVRRMQIQPPSQINPDVPEEIDDIIMTALEREPARRWQHATALRAAMTTLTQRLGLECTNQAAIEWITWMLAQPRKNSARLAPRAASASEASAEPSVQIEVQSRSDSAVATRPSRPSRPGYPRPQSQPGPSSPPGRPGPPSRPSQPLTLKMGNRPPSQPPALKLGSPPPQALTIKLGNPPPPPATQPAGTPVRPFTAKPAAPAAPLPRIGEAPAIDAGASITDVRPPDLEVSVTDATELRRPDDAISTTDPTELHRPEDAAEIVDDHQATLLYGGAPLAAAPAPLRALQPPRRLTPEPMAAVRPRLPSAPLIPQPEVPLEPEPQPLQPLPYRPGLATTRHAAPPAAAGAAEHRPGAPTIALVAIVAAAIAAAAVYVVLTYLG